MSSAKLINKILGYQPLTRDGLKLQCRAMIMDGYGSWDDCTGRFVGTLMLFLAGNCRTCWR
jgi:hypothetical protein